MKRVVQMFIHAVVGAAIALAITMSCRWLATQAIPQEPMPISVRWTPIIGQMSGLFKV